MHVFITVPEFSPEHKGLFAIGRFFPFGESGPHEVTSQEYSKLLANKRLAVRVATGDEIQAGKAIAAQTSAPGLTDDEKALLDSFRSAKAQKVSVTLARIDEIDQAHIRAGELEAEAKRLAASMKDLEAQVKSAGKGEQELKARIGELETAKAQLEAQVKAAQESKPKK